MSLINGNLINNDIIHSISKINDIDNKLIYCDLSGLNLSNDNFTLKLTPQQPDSSNSPNSVVKCNVLFRNNGKNPIINTLIINNVPIINHFINNRDTTTTSQMTNQEFIITFDTSIYTSISTIRKYN
jgi:hypothetical protein